MLFLPFEIICNVYAIVISIQSPFLATGLVIMALHISYCNLNHTGIGYENSWSTVCNMNLRGSLQLIKYRSFSIGA